MTRFAFCKDPFRGRRRLDWSRDRTGNQRRGRHWYSEGYDNLTAEGGLS